MRKDYVAYYGANSLFFTIDCKRRNFNAGDGQTAILCIFLLQICSVSVHNRVYLHVSLHIFFFFNMKNEATLFIVVELKRSFAYFS